MEPISDECDHQLFVNELNKNDVICCEENALDLSSNSKSDIW